MDREADRDRRRTEHPRGARTETDREVGLGSPAPASTADTRELAELRELLVGGERRQLEELRRRLDTFEVSPDEMAEHLPEAIAIRGARDGKLARALAPAMEGAISESVRRNPREIATAIFPVLGPAIRKAMAETMSGLVESINRAIEHSLTPRGVRWRFEAWRTGVPFAEVVIKHALVYRVEQVFLVHAETGLLLRHAPDDLARDADVISGMMTAISEFVKDSFAPRATGELRTFAVDDVSVIVETGPRAYLAAVVRGVPPASLRDRLAAVLETIHLQSATALAHFDGNAAPFADTQPLLEECLETVLSTSRSRATGGLARFAWLIPVALVLALGAVWLVWSNQRWSRAVVALEQEPGIVLVRADRGLGGWRFSGLRDPLAASPGALLAGAGADTTSVEATWEPYVSMQPKILLERARRMLGAPAGITLSLTGDTLVANGQAPRSWIRRAATVATVLPGIAYADLAGVTEVLPTEIEALRRDLGEQRILFAPGSATLDSIGRIAADSTAARLTRLEAAATREGYEVTVALVGRTDTLGSVETRVALGLARAEAVRSAIATRGLSVQNIEIRSLGSSDPVPAADPDSFARINRSVDIEITVSDASARDGSP